MKNLILIIAVSLLSGCSVFRPAELKKIDPSETEYSGTNENITVLLQMMEPGDMKSHFDFFLFEENIQPYVLHIKNSSGDSVIFKANEFPFYIPADEIYNKIDKDSPAKNVTIGLLAGLVVPFAMYSEASEQGDEEPEKYLSTEAFIITGAVGLLVGLGRSAADNESNINLENFFRKYCRKKLTVAPGEIKKTIVFSRIFNDRDANDHPEKFFIDEEGRVFYKIFLEKQDGSRLRFELFPMLISYY